MTGPVSHVKRAQSSNTLTIGEFGGPCLVPYDTAHGECAERIHLEAAALSDDLQRRKAPQSCGLPPRRARAVGRLEQWPPSPKLILPPRIKAIQRSIALSMQKAIVPAGQNLSAQHNNLPAPIGISQWLIAKCQRRSLFIFSFSSEGFWASPP